MTIDKFAALRKTDLFGALSDDLLKKIAGYVTNRQLTPGQLLFSEDEEAHGLYIIAEGELRSVRQNPEGREQVLSTEGPGAVLAVAPLFSGGKFFSTVVADSAAQVLSLEKGQLHQLCREHPEILWNVARILAHKIRHYTELIESLALRNVEQRVGQHLLTVARERGVRVGDGCVVELNLTRSQIASRLGSTREVVSRAFTHLQKSGLIRMEGRRLVTIPSMQALSAFVDAPPEGEAPDLVSELSSELV